LNAQYIAVEDTVCNEERHGEVGEGKVSREAVPWSCGISSCTERIEVRVRLVEYDVELISYVCGIEWCGVRAREPSTIRVRAEES